jgi:hypothetical protein
MAAKVTDKPEKANPDEQDIDEKGAPSELNSPELDEKDGKPKSKAISSFKQAHAIAKRQFDLAKEGRLVTAAVIADKYGGSPPFPSLKKTGQSWRNNFSTNPFGAVADRSTPQLTTPIKQAEYLTYSALPAERENAAEKTRKFRKRFTKLVRAWSGFMSLVGQVAQEDYIYGNAAPGWIDDDWRPRAFRYDETFLPEGTGQHASQAQFIVYRQPVLLHEFLEKIKDREIAEAAGYNWEGCIKAANEAAGLRSGGSDSSPVEQADAVREGGALGFTHEGETKIVWLFHVLVREYSGGVDLWTVSQKGGHGVRSVEGLHESMEDASTFFTLQEGNTKFYGSRGAGRQLTNLHIALDRHRNFGADKAYLAGLPIFKVKGKDVASVQTHVRTPFMFVLGDVEMQAEVISFDATSHEYLDKSLSGQMEAVAGAFIPPKIDNSGSSNTKIEAAQKAERELAVKDGVLGRFFGQFADMVSAMQRKVCKPENLKEAYRIFEENKAKREKGVRVLAKRVWTWLKEVMGEETEAEAQEVTAVADPEAVQMLVELLEDGLTVEDIIEIALSPSGNNAEEKPEEQDAKTVGFVQGIQGTPLAPYFETRECAKMVGEISIGEDRTNRLLIPDKPDPNVEAYAIREQTQEWLALAAGEPQPVVITDNHAIHRKVLQPKLGVIMEALGTAPSPEMFTVGQAGLGHYAAHVQSDTMMSEEVKAQEVTLVEQWGQILEAAGKTLEQMEKQAAEAGVPGGASGMPSPIQGVPPQVGPDGSIAGTEGDLDREKLDRETAIKLTGQEIEHRRLDIEEKKLKAKEEKDAMDATIGVLKTAAEQTAAARNKGIEDARKDAEIQAAKQNPGKPSI